MGWRTLADFLDLGLSEEELQSLEARRASRATLRKLANRDLAQELGEGLTKYFQLDADISSEGFNEHFGDPRTYEAGQLIPQLHDFSTPANQAAWTNAVAQMKAAKPAVYRALTNDLKRLFGREPRGKLNKAKARIEWTILRVGNWNLWDYRFIRQNYIPIEQPFPKDRSFDVAIELKLALPS
jgi:hypothetical protein